MNHHGLFPYISCVQELCIDRLTCWVDLVFPKRQRMGAKAEILCYLVLKEFVRHSRRVYSITIPLHPVTKLARKYWFDIMKMLEKHQQINKVNFWGFRMHEDPAQLEDQFQFRHHVFHLIRSQRKLSYVNFLQIGRPLLICLKALTLSPRSTLQNMKFRFVHFCSMAFDHLKHLDFLHNFEFLGFEKCTHGVNQTSFKL